MSHIYNNTDRSKHLVSKARRNKYFTQESESETDHFQHRSDHFQQRALDPVNDVPKYILFGNIRPSEDWDLDSHVARLYYTFEEMLSNVRKIVASEQMILPFARSLQYPISLPWFSPAPTDRRATLEQLVDWVSNNIDKLSLIHI